VANTDFVATLPESLVHRFGKAFGVRVLTPSAPRVSVALVARAPQPNASGAIKGSHLDERIGNTKEHDMPQNFARSLEKSTLECARLRQ
jgi:hypothetical protein